MGMGAYHVYIRSLLVINVKCLLVSSVTWTISRNKPEGNTCLLLIMLGLWCSGKQKHTKHQKRSCIWKSEAVFLTLRPNDPLITFTLTDVFGQNDKKSLSAWAVRLSTLRKVSSQRKIVRSNQQTWPGTFLFFCILITKKGQMRFLSREKIPVIKPASVKRG